ARRWRAGARLAPPREAGDDVAARALVALELDDALALGILEQLGERRVAEVPLVERRALALHRLLDHRAPEHVLVLAGEGEDRLGEQTEHLLLLLRERVELGHAVD